jgi:hypothetical protein
MEKDNTRASGLPFSSQKRSIEFEVARRSGDTQISWYPVSHLKHDEVPVHDICGRYCLLLTIPDDCCVLGNKVLDRFHDARGMEIDDSIES